MTQMENDKSWDLLNALYIIALGDKENSIKTINSLLKVNYSDDVKKLLITLRDKLNLEE